MSKTLTLIFVLSLATCQLQAQEKATESGAMLYSLGYAFQLPGADMADRFGSNFSLSLQAEYLTKKDWGLRLEGGFIFGNLVKEDVLASIRTAQGNIIGNDRALADIQLRERGLYLGLGLSKLVRFSSASRSGLLISGASGFLQHKIRIQDDPIRGVSQLTEDLKKGYDRLSNGLYISEFVGYRYLANDRRINFYIGLEATQAFTQNRRSYNYDLQSVDNEPRLDLLYGIKVGWILPFYLESAEDIFY